MSETIITRNPDQPISDYAGQPYTFITWDGEAKHGTTEVMEVWRDDHGNTADKLIVRFPDGKWAHARYQWA